MSAPGCPAREVLWAYQTGELPEMEAEAVILHLSQCPICQASLKTFGEAQDSLLARLRRPEAERYTVEPQCRELLAWAKAYRTRSLTCQCGERFQLDADEGDKQIRCAACGAILAVPELQALRPPASPQAVDLAETQPGPLESPGHQRRSIERDTEATQDFGVASANDSKRLAGEYGSYILVRPLAQGGMGKVSIARDEPLKREVALKELLEVGSSNKLFRRRFLEEAEITGQLEHPGIIPIYALGTDRQGLPFYTMRLVHGMTLKEVISEHHNSYSDTALRELLRRFVAVCQTVAYAHARGVVHRDIKPSNIMLGKYGETLVMDWGLAKPVGDGTTPESPMGDLAEQYLADRREVTEPGAVVGTPAYMSPEQAAGTLDGLGFASDVYSLGTVLYQILTGKPAYSGASSAEIIEKVRTTSPQKPSALCPTVPRPLEAVCLKAMARESAERYSTALALAEEVQGWLDDEPVVAYQEPMLERLFRWARKHKTLASSVALFSIALALVIAVGSEIVAHERAKTLAAQKLAENYAQQAAEAERKAQEKEAEAMRLAQEVDKARAEAAEALQQAVLSEWSVKVAKARISQLETELQAKAEQNQELNKKLDQAQVVLAAAEAASRAKKEMVTATADRIKILEKEGEKLRTEAQELRALAAKLTQLASGTIEKEKDPAKQPDAGLSTEGDFTLQGVAAFDASAADMALTLLTTDTAKAGPGRQSLRLDTLSTADVCITYPKSRNANWDLSKKTKLGVTLAVDDPATAFRQEGVRVRLGRGSNAIQCRFQGDFLTAIRGGRARFVFPLEDDASWTRGEVEGFDLSHVDWPEVHIGAEIPGMKLWVDSLTFEP
jgi:serine/threonine protein kinase